ncbi:MAG TPA: hypothetical protein VIH83_06670 [Candidatus Bathyarchaeia archaeon]
MVIAEVNAVLAWLHILAAIGWMGTAMFLVMVLTPSMRRLSPSSRRDLILKLFPRFIRYVTVFATLTLVAGILLAFAYAGSNLESLSPTTRWGFMITVGASLALVAYALALGLGLRSARKIVKILNTQQDPQRTPPPEIMKLQVRMRLTATTVMILLMLSLVFMVAASRLPQL